MTHSRREFLEQSMFAATAALATGGSLRAETVASGRHRTSADTLRVAVVGVNGRGGSHISGFMNLPDVQVVCLCDCDEAVGKNRVEKLQQQVGYPVRFEQDLRKLVQDESIDIITIATPNHWHSLAGIWAVQHGKDVYVEKPVSHNVSEGRRFVQAARKYDRIVQTGTQCRTMKGSRDAIDFVHNGGIGEVKLARGLCYKRRNSIGERGNYDVPASVDYNLWLGPAPDEALNRNRFHYDWHWQWDYGNGDLGNQGIHQMDIARWGLNESDIGNSVQSFGGRFGYEDAGETANTQVCTHTFSSGNKLIFEVRGLETPPFMGASVGVIFHGSDGYLVTTSYTNAAAFDNDGNMIRSFSGGGDHFANFIEAVRNRDRSLLNADIEEGHLSSALCHLGNVSYRLGSPRSFDESFATAVADEDAFATAERMINHLESNKISADSVAITVGPRLTIDPAAEVFTGDMADRANPMLTRNYREGFAVPDEASL